MLRTYKYLLRPNHEQANRLDFLLEQSRLVYNAALEQRIRLYRETGQGIGYGRQWTYFRDLRREHPETIGQLNASGLQHLLRRLDKAYQAFFRRAAAGELAGFPRFKPRSRFKSLEFTYGDGCKLRQNEHGRMRFYVQNAGEMRMSYHRAIPKGARIKHAVVKRMLARWYVCLMLELPDPAQPRSPRGKQIGIDVGLKSMAALSNGERIDHPGWLRHSLSHLRRLQRQAARQVNGSHRQRVTYARLASWHARVQNQRSDTLHKLSRQLVSNYDLIAIEDLPLAFMNRHRHLSRSSHDAGLGLFRQMLTYKAEEAGAQLVAVNPTHTTQVCSRCGGRVPKDLSVRVHDCPHCGLLLDRDVNAARNILNLALNNPHGRCGQTVTWAVAPGVV